MIYLNLFFILSQAKNDITDTFVVNPLIRSLRLPSTDKNFDFKKLGVRSIKILTLPSEPFRPLFKSTFARESTIVKSTYLVDLELIPGDLKKKTNQHDRILSE